MCTGRNHVSVHRGVFDKSQSAGISVPRPTVNLFEQWEEGAHTPRLVNARDYSFPKSRVVPFTWMYAPNVLSLSDAVNYVSQHEEPCVGSSIRDQTGTWDQLSKST